MGEGEETGRSSAPRWSRLEEMPQAAEGLPRLLLHLDLEGDPYAAFGARAYADAIDGAWPQLARALRRALGLPVERVEEWKTLDEDMDR